MLVAVAVLVTTGCQAAPPARTSPAPGSTHHAGTANRTLATAEAARLIRDFPVPPGAREQASTPVLRLQHLRAFDGDVDRSLTRTRFWTVPLSARAAVAWYAAHTPANISGAFFDIAKKQLSPLGDLTWETASGSDAYSAPAYVVSYKRRGPHATALRTDVTLAARYDRAADTKAPTNLTEVEIDKQALNATPAPPDSARVTDPAEIARIVAAFNGLHGDDANVAGFACGSPVGEVDVYTVTFRWPGHILVADPGVPLCDRGRGLTLDGRKLPQTLEDSDTFDNVVQGALTAS
jgi:hypothetical protein